MKKYFCLSFILLTVVFACLRDECTDNTMMNGGTILLRGWSTYISPVDGPACGFRPTCAQYSREAIRKYGAVQGAIMTADRLQRCNPCLNAGIYPKTSEGYLYDPVSANVES